MSSLATNTSTPRGIVTPGRYWPTQEAIDELEQLALFEPIDLWPTDDTVNAARLEKAGK